jgi:hypothetical protein
VRWVRAFVVVVLLSLGSWPSVGFAQTTTTTAAPGTAQQVVFPPDEEALFIVTAGLVCLVCGVEVVRVLWRGVGRSE